MKVYKGFCLLCYGILLGFCLWVAITSCIYSFVNPSKTQTEVFLHIPESCILSFTDIE